MKISRFNRILALLLVLTLAFSDCNIPGVKAEEISAQTEEDAQYTESSEEESAEAEETTENDASGNDESEDASETVEPADEGGSDETEAVEENTNPVEEGGSDETEAVEENTEAADEGGSDEAEAVEENTDSAEEGGNDEAEAVEGNTEPADEDEQLPEPGQGKVDIEGVIQSGAAAYRITGSANQSIFIGDAESYEEDSEYRPLEQDITISVDELQMGENTAVTIRQVYGGSQKVILNVDQASQIEALSIEDGAALELNLDADIFIQSLALGKDSSLTVHTNGHTCTVSGDIYGTGAAAEDGEPPVSGAVRVTGTGTVSVAGDFAASELNIEDASVTAANLSAAGDMNLTNAVLSTAGGNGSVTADGNITVNGSTVKDAALFGYGEDAEGEKTITFSENCTLSNAAVVGASENCGAKVTIVGSGNIGSSTNTAYICDYKITYLEEETELQPEAEWPVSYRVKHGSLSGSDRTILGSHTAGSVYSSAEGNTVTLPVYTKEGYGYAGWLTEESGEPVLELKDQTGMLTLTAVLTAGDVTAVLDLGYEPNENTNDPDENGKRPERYTALEGTKLGDVLTLETPSRFGYNFKGWKAVTGSQNKIYTDSYTVSLADLDTDSETSAYKLTLEAQWEAEAFPLRLVLSSEVPAENVEISVDGGSSWESLETLGGKDGFAWDASSKTLSFSENIAYGQSLRAYFEALDCTYPVLRDTRAASVRKKFITWITTNGTAVTEESCYPIEEGGILESRGSRTLTQYQSYLLTNPVMLTTQWGEMEYTITTDKADDFTMPTADVAAEYATTLGLYLENGTIEITPDGYTQNGKFVTWPGDYEILMDEENNSDGSATLNVLSLSGNLSDRTIALGNLNITSNDSIRLKEGAEVTLTTEYGGTPSTITAKNILVPKNTALSMKSGEAGAGTLVLTPDAAQNKAAIGGSNAANGTIDLEGLHVQMTLSGPSDASGIGSGNQTAGGSDVLLNQCEITVKEESGSGQPYKGAWIGGAGVSLVTVRGSEVNMDADSTAMVGPYVLNGTFVNVTENSSIGTKDVPVCDPIYAKQKLTIQNSAVYQKITSNLGDVSAVGTSAGGTVEVTASTIQTEASGAGQTNELYTGTMKIMDITSDVRILNTQILEVSYGTVQITNTKAVQGDNFLPGKITHTHSGSYLLLEELPPNELNAPDLTVNSLAPNAVITVKQPAEASNNMAVMLHALRVGTDVPVILEGNLKVGGTVTITAGKTLSVTADEDSSYGVDFTDETPFADNANANAAAYEQTNGSLKCPPMGGAAGGDNLTVKLNGVTAEVHSLYAKDLTLIDSKVTANSTEGVVGSRGKTGAVTHVTIEGETNITAKTIGSLGTADKTFTLVDIENEDAFTWKGTLVRDRYRLTYEGLDDNFDNSANPLVLRTEQDSNGTKEGTGTEKVIPTILEDPKYVPEGTSYFAVWYINAENKTPTALCSDEKAGTVKSEYGFTATLPGLLPEHIAYAEENDDGTRTLTVYARMLVQGTGVITAGRQFEAFDTEKTDVSVPADGAWTALFTSTGTSIAGRDYQVSFEEALPEGTRLTLAVLKEDDVPKYYYQVLESASDKLLFSEFVRMGSDSEKLSPGSAAAGTAEERFLLAADFAGTEAAVKEDQTVTFALAVGDSPVEIAKVTYALTDIPAGSIQASPAALSGETFTGTVTVTPPADDRLDGRQLILLAELTDEEGKAVSVPYGAEMALTGSDNTKIPADWIGGSRALFRLGAYGSVSGGSSYTWNLGGLEAGDYTITWKLASAEDEKDVNVLGSLMKAEEVSVTLSRAEVEPSLKVMLDLIDGTASAGRVLAAGQSHSIRFSCSTHDDNSTKVTVKAEKQNTTLASFSETSDVTCEVNADKSVTVEFSSSASGTYRIRFSIAEDSEEDDVYYTFIVK